MKSHLPEKLYLASPVWLQNCLVSLYGYLEHNNRYKGVYHTLSEELFGNEFKTKNQLDPIINERLNKILEHALSSVPYYQSLGIKETKIDNFPILDRQRVANSSEKFISKKYSNDKLLNIYTGGSTGTPLKVSLNRDIRQKTYAFWNRFYKSIGFNIGDKKATFVGRKVQEPDNNKPPFWRYNLKDRQLIFSSFHMTEENLSDYIQKLNTFKPALIEGYPLSVHRLAEYILSNKIKLTFTPVGISTSSENFSDAERNAMEEAFNCKVFDQYGSAESVVFASECAFGKKHISVEYGLLEILNENGKITPTGEGEFIVTTLLNDVMPLIRYRIGDLGKVSNEPCPCGRHTPIIEQLYGKVGAVIVTKEKRVPTAAISIAFEYLKNIKNAQIIQNAPDKVVVNLATKPGFNQDEENFMLWELKKMLSDDMEIEVNHVNSIPSGKNGKYQMVIQNYYT